MAWSPAEIPDQAGRSYVITGANGGLGRIAAKVLAERGATVVMACRNVAAGEKVAKDISGDVSVAELDLADLASVRKFAENSDSTDVLINNAGIMNTPFGKTADGFEMQFGVNHLGHFALTGLMLDRVGERVVTLSSIAHAQTPKFWIDDLNYENRFYQRNLAYAQSKLANLMFARELERRLSASGSPVHSYGVHPGVSGTDLFTNTETIADKFGKFFADTVGHAPEKAVHSTLLAATKADADPAVFWGPKGGFGQTRGPAVAARSSRLSRNRDLWKRLWETSERMTGVSYL